ncbi:RIMS-binding protein 2 [Acropora cervicornis]|uniref:RIMS-binding protein 2 n=1 Tax=Acropora cervicornis TaxID=6130 RepID=A0AAD9VFQ8_ACRCE|nr:RIMS-binding protein 2 [Acropora cervicornis]
MSRGQSWKNSAPGGENTVELWRTNSQPSHGAQSTGNELSPAAPSKSNMEDMRRRVVHLNKELEKERTYSKNLKRDKALEIRQVRDEEQKKATTMLAELRSKLHKEKIIELTSLREQLRKEKEKDLVQIIRQKDEVYRTAQQAWAKEKDEVKLRLRTELRIESREDTKREFENERGRLEQDISDLHRQKKELEDTLRLVQDADKRKIDDMRRIHHDHELELEKFKRNSWQESRQQDTKPGNQELKMLQRKNVELSSLVRKLDEKNQQLATRNAELLAELETLEKDSRDKNRKTERKNADLLQTNKRLESRNKMLLDEINTMKKHSTKKGGLAKPRGQAAKESDALDNMKEQLREQTRTIADLKQNLMDKDRRIELLRGRKKKKRQQSSIPVPVSANYTSVEDDDVLSVYSDFSETSEMEKQQLQSDLLESQTRIHELERMINDNGQDVKELKDQRDLLEFELEEMSQLSTADSEDWGSRRPRRTLSLDSSLSQGKGDDSSSLSFEEIKSCLEELENEKESTFSPFQQKALKQARAMLDSMAEKINHLEITEFALRDKVRDLDLGYNSPSLRSDLNDSTNSVFTYDQETLTDLQRVELDAMESFFRQKQGEVAEHSTEIENQENLTEDKCTTTQLVLEDLDNMETIYNEFQNGLLKETCEYPEHAVLETEDKESMTDLAWLEISSRQIDSFSQIYLEDGLQREKGEVYRVEKETMTDLYLEELRQLGNNSQKYVEESISLRPRDNKGIMTDVIWEELIERTNEATYSDLRRELDAQWKGKGREAVDVGVMTDLALLELVEMENKYFEYTENESVVDILKDDNVEALPEIVLDTFPEDPASRKDNYVMTELRWEHIIDLENKCSTYEHDIEELERAIADSYVVKDEKNCGTDLSYRDIIAMQEKCLGYECVIEELEKRLAQFDVEKSEKGTGTEISLKDLCNDRFTCDMRGEDTLTNEIEGSVNVVLPRIVQETFPGDVQTKDECDMTDGVWEEVEELKNTYLDYRQNLEEMKNKLAQFEVEKDDKESLTDIAMQDLADLESIYKEHLREVDSDTNSMLSNVEKESRECMTELTAIEITELEDFYIENAANQLPQSPIVEKWEQESMTEITLNEMQYLDETEELYRQKVNGGPKVDKCTETDLTTTGIDSMDEEPKILAVDKQDAEVMTEMALSDLQYLEGVEQANAECLVDTELEPEALVVDKQDAEVMTEMALSDLQYLEGVEQANAECLVDTELEPEALVVDKQDAEVMTEMALSDLQYLEDVEQANAECLVDTELEPEALVVDKQDAEVMTEMALSDLQYLEGVEQAYSECLVDTELRPEALVVDKQDAEVMTEMALSDLQYLEDVEQANAECLVDTELEPEALVVDKQDAEVMTEMALSDLQYLEGVEQAYSECLVDTELKPEALVVDKQDAEVMTEMALSDLQYLEGVEQANAECLVDTELELEALVVDKQDAEVMTEMALSDLQYLEGVEQANAECLVDTELEPKAFVVDKQDVEVMTEIALSDLQYLEDVEQAHEECRVDTEVEPKTLVVDKQDVEVMTEMPLSGLLYLEDDEQAHEECLADEEEEPNVLVMDKPNAEIMTEMADLHNLEKVESPHEECLADEVEVTEVRSIPVEKESVEIMTDMNVVDLQSSENKLECFENSCKNKANAQTMTDLTLSELHLLEDNLEELRADCTERCNAEIMTDLTGVDLNNWKETGDVQEALEECFAQTTQVEMENVEIMTDLTVLNLQYLETVECAHQKCLAVKHSVATMNDLPNQDPKSLESSPSAGKERRSSLWRRKSRSSSVTDHLHHKNTMTEMTGNMLEYYEDIEGIYKETVVKMEEMKTLLFVEKQESDVMTDLTAEDLEYLEEESEKAREGAKASVDEKVMTELTHEDLEYLIEVEMFHKDVDLERCKRDLPLLCDATTMTELSFPDVEYAEKELYRLKQKRSQDTDSSWVVIEPAMEDKNVMTEIPTAQLNCPKKFEVHHMENMTKSMETACCNDAETMTDLTLPDIEYLEEAENLLKTVSGNGGDMAALLAPKDDKEVITDLVSSDIDYLVLLGDIDRDGNRDDTSSPEKDDKQTETELTIADIRDLEDQVHDATGRKTVSSFQEFGNEDLLPETQVSLQSELEYLPVLDETEFILLDEDEDVISRRETEVMTELTISDIRDLEDQVVSARNFKAPHVKENFEVETLDSLQSQLEYLPVLDEPEFILDDEEDFMQRQDAGVMTEITLFDLEHLLEDEILGNEGIVKSFEKKDNTSMTELTISELAFLETSGPRLDNEVLNTADISEAAIQCDLENLSSLMQELNREAEEHGEYFPAWFVTALNLRRPELGFNPIHLVVRQSDVVDAEPTGELSDTKFPLGNEIEKTPIPNALNDSMNSLEDGMSNLHDEGTLDVSDRGSWKEGEDAILSKDVSIQCELIDVVAMLAEYKENEKQEEEAGTLFISQDDSYSMSNQTEDPNVPATDAENSDLLTDMPRGSSAMNRFDRFLQERKDSERLNLQKFRENLEVGEDGETEQRDVITDMQQDGSAVNTFDRFLKERQDSEVLNLETLKQTLETAGDTGRVDAKCLKDLEDENKVLKRQVQLLENAKNTAELEEEIAALKEQIQTKKGLEEENQLLREEINILKETAELEEQEKENGLLKEKIQMLEDKEIDDDQDFKAVDRENEKLREKSKALEESMNAEDLEMENDFLKQQVKVEQEKAKELEKENGTLHQKILVLEETARSTEGLEMESGHLKQQIEALSAERKNMEELVKENVLLKARMETMVEAQKIKEREGQNDTLKMELHQMHEKSLNVQDLVNQNILLKEQIEIMNEAAKEKQLEYENQTLKDKMQLLEESEIKERLANEDLIQRIQDMEQSTARVVKRLEEENAILKENIQMLEEATASMQDLENENALLREKINLFGSSKYDVDLSTEELELLKLKVEQLRAAERKIGELNEANMALKERIELLQMEKKSVRDNWSEMDPSEQIGKTDRGVQGEYGDATSILRLLEVTEDGSIPEHIAKGRQVGHSSNEATQTEHAQLISGDVTSQGAGSSEEIITPQVHATIASEISFPDDVLGKFESLDGVKIRDSSELVSEPQIVSSQKNMDSFVDDIERRVQDLANLNEDVGKARPNANDFVLFDSDYEGDLPPLPESSPPPLPSQPPYFPEGSPTVLDGGIEFLLKNESSPPRDAATLRASSRARSRSQSKTASEKSQGSSRAESPVTVEESTVVLESDPSQLGGILPGMLHSQAISSSFKKPSDQGPTKVAPQILPKPKRPLLQMRQATDLHKPLVSHESTDRKPSVTSQWSRDEEDGVIPRRGIVRDRASSINRGEIGALKEKIEFLEKQLKNKENFIRGMKKEASDLETKSMLERKEREMKILDEDVAFLKKEVSNKTAVFCFCHLIHYVRCSIMSDCGTVPSAESKERERAAYQGESSIGELNKKNHEIEQWKSEASDSERQRQKIEADYTDLQNKMKGLKGAELKLAETQSKCSGMEKQNVELSDKVQVLEMDIVEQDRNQLVEKMKIIENQRDDLLRKGKMVESERNNFLRSNKLMEMQKDDLEGRCNMLQKTNLAELEREAKEAQTKMHDSQHERNFLKVQLDKMETEKNDMQKRFAITTQERNSLENQVAELQDLSRDHAKLEDGCHLLRLKLAELTRGKDDAELQIPTLKAKISLLKKACKDKDEAINDLSEEIRELRHSIATSALDDLSKIRTYGYSPENFEEFSPSLPGTKKAKRFVVLFDYDPQKSPASEHPELELKLKEGDFLTVFGDMDTEGYFEADLNGVRGLVPSLYVDEVEDENDSDRELDELMTTSRPDKINEVPFGKDNELPYQREVISNGQLVSDNSSVDAEQHQCVVALHDYNPFMSGFPGRPPHEQLPLKKGDVMTTHGDMDTKGFYHVELAGQTGFVPGHLVEVVSSSSLLHHVTPSRTMSTSAVIPSNGYPLNSNVTSPHQVRLPVSPLPNVGLTRFKPSPEVAHLGASSASIVPAASHPSSPRSAPSAATNKPLTTSITSSPSKQVVPFSSSRSKSIGKARPNPPNSFRVLRPVNHDAMLLAWTLPKLDEFGRSNGLAVKGYKIFANDEVKLDVRSPYMAKALVEDLDLQIPIKFSIKTVAQNSISSSAVSTMFSDIIKRNPLPLFRNLALFRWLWVAHKRRKAEKQVLPQDSSGESLQDSGGEEERYRTFVALYDYDPFKSSPNPNPESELRFKEGDILRVFNTSRKDGFYVGKLKHKSGLIPSNFVEEVAVASPRRLAAAKKHHVALPSHSRPYSRESGSSKGADSPSFAAKDVEPLRRKVMVAIYDYNPELQSPQDNPDSELAFRKGQLLTVIGEVRSDGFYQAELNGQRGLVPGSFLDEYIDKETDSGLPSERHVSLDTGRPLRYLGGLNQV